MNRITLKEYAKILNGREYGYPQFTKEEIEIAKANNFVIIYGASDDLIEFEGAIYDEGGVYEGGTVYLNLNKKRLDEENNYETVPIIAKWCEEKNENNNIITWTYDINIAHETFMIYDNGEPYCRGLVFQL